MISNQPSSLIDAAVQAQRREDDKQFAKERRRLRRMLWWRLGRRFLSLIQWDGAEAVIDGIRFRCDTERDWYSWGTDYRLMALLNGHTEWQRVSDLPGLGRLISERHDDEVHQGEGEE